MMDSLFILIFIVLLLGFLLFDFQALKQANKPIRVFYWILFGLNCALIATVLFNYRPPMLTQLLAVWIRPIANALFGGT